MAVNASFRSFVLDQLSRVVSGVRPRAMFGGVGVYSRDVFFALMAGDTLYLKVDDTNRGDFEARGLGPFRPFGEHGEVMSYYAVDESILEDLDELRHWCDKAIAVGLSKKTKPRKLMAKKKATGKGGVRGGAKKSSRKSAKKRR